MSYAFTCPTCGSHEFGTSGNQGYCHGHMLLPSGAYQKCIYSWSRSKDAELFPSLLVDIGKTDVATSIK